VPTITLEGDANGAPHPDPNSYARKFSGKYAHRTIEGGIGHNLPQEAPQAFAKAVIEVDRVLIVRTDRQGGRCAMRHFAYLRDMANRRSWGRLTPY